MKKYYFVSIFIFLLSTSITYAQNIYQSVYYRQPPANAFIDIKDVKVNQDTTDKRMKSLSASKKAVVQENLAFAKEYLNDGDVLKVYDYLDDIDAILSDLPEVLYLRALAHQKIGDISFVRYYFLRALEIGTNDYALFYDAIAFFNEMGLYSESVYVCLYAYKQSKDASWLFEAAEITLIFDEKSANHYFILLAKSSYDAFGVEGISDIAANNGFYDVALHGYYVAIKDFEKSKYKKTKLSDSNIARITEKIDKTKINIVVEDWQQKIDNKEFVAALDLLKTISGNSHIDDKIFLLNAKTYAQMSKYIEAQTLLEYSININNNLEDAFIVAAQIELNNGDILEAVDMIEEGLIYNYDKISLYNMLLSLLECAESKYYYDSVISALSDVLEPDYEMALRLSKYYLERSEYQKSLDIINALDDSEEVLLIKERVMSNILLGKSEQNRKLKKYQNIVRDLNNKKFSNEEDEDLRVRLLSLSFFQLGDLESAIQILVDKFNDGTISLNNTYYLQYLISNSSNSMGLVTDELVKNIDDWEKIISSSYLHITNRINEFLVFEQFYYALEYLNELKESASIDTKLLDNLEAKVYSQMAGDFYDKGDINQARKYTSLSLSKNKSDIDAIHINKLLNFYSRWGAIANDISKDNDKNTITIASNFLSQFPSRIDIRMTLLRNLGLYENIDTTISIIEQISSMNIYEYLKMSILSDIYYRFGMYDYCAILYRKSLDYKFDMHTSLMYIQTLENLGRSNEALALALEEEAQNQKNSYIKYILSKLYISRGDISSAYRSINDAIKISDNIDYLLQLGLCYEANGELEKAFNVYADILEKNSSYSEAYVRQVEVLLKNETIKENLARAEILSEKLIELDNDNAYYYYLLANIYYNIAFFDEASNRSDDIKMALLLFQEALNKALYGSDKQLRVLIKDKIEILNKNMVVVNR